MARYNSAQASNSISGATTIGSPYSGSFTNLTGSAPYTVTLPNPVTFPGTNQTFYNVTSGTVTLSTPSGAFNGTGGSSAATILVYAGNVLSVTSDGTNYIVISEDGSALVATSGTFSGVLTVQASGGVSIAPSSAGTIDNVAIGSSSRSSGAFTTLTANGALTTTANISSSSTTTGSLVVTGGIGVTGSIYAGATVSATSLTATNVTGTLQTAAQPNITSVGSLTATGLTVDSGTLYVDITNDRVGVGTTGPQTVLELATTATVNSSPYSQIKHLTLSRQENTRYNAYAGFGDQFGGNTFGWRFGTVNNSTDYPTLYMVNGNVGIGTSATPASPLTVSAVSGDGVPLLRLTSTSAPGAVNWISSSMNSSLTANASTVHLFGQAQSQYNSGYVGFRYAGASSSSNYLTLGLYASDYLLNILGNGNVGIGTTSPQVTFETGYTRVYNSGAAPSIGTGGPGKGLELHYVTSGRTQGEGGYAISYDRANSAYKAFTIDASAINLSQSGATKVTIALGMLNVEPNLNIYSSNAGTASANGFCELFRVGHSSLCTSGIFSLGATRGGYVAGGLFTWSTTHNGSGRGVITQLSSGEYSNFSLSADVASDGSVIICADWGSSQSYSISVIKFVGGYIDYANAGTLWSSPNGSYPARYTRSTIALGFKTQNGAFDGSLSKGSGSFRIDHPLPELTETHALVHSFIEGPQADLIYRGRVDLAAGHAEVNIDSAADMTEGTFELLCRDVQCFTTNESDWTAVRGSVTGNILTIEAESNLATSSVSWMVIGERKDKHMYDTEWTDDSGKVIVEPLKNPVQTDFPPYPENVNTSEDTNGTL